MTRRLSGFLVASVFSAVMLLASACTSNSGSPSSTTPAPTASALLSVQKIVPVFMQCLAEHNVPIWDKSQGNMNVISVGEKEGWYKNGRVVANNALYTDMDSLEGTYPISRDFKPYQTIATWVDNAATTGAWPKVCGSLPKAP